MMHKGEQGPISVYSYNGYFAEESEQLIDKLLLSCEKPGDSLEIIMESCPYNNRHSITYIIARGMKLRYGSHKMIPLDKKDQNQYALHLCKRNSMAICKPKDSNRRKLNISSIISILTQCTDAGVSLLMCYEGELIITIWGGYSSFAPIKSYFTSLGYDTNYLPMEVFQQYNYLMTGVKSLRSMDKEFETSPSHKLSPPASAKGIYMGKLKESNASYHLPLDQLTKHMVIAGMSGSGKTTLLFRILYELHKKKVPFLIIEPTKTEYRELRSAIPDLKILTPGRTDVCPILFNPFLPPKGVTLEQFLPSLISAFQMAFSMTTPLDVILPEVIRNCYVTYDWRNDSTSDSPDVKIFGMHEFICAFREEVQKSSYDPESKQNLNSGGVYRLQSLINSNPYLFDTDKSLSIDDLLKENTLIELDAIDNPEHKTLFLALLLLQLKLVIRKNQRKDSSLKNVIMIDEAHVLLGNKPVSVGKNEANPVGKLQEYLLDMVKVNRVYGSGMIFADQSLAILEEFVNNSNIKIAMHLESAQERRFLMDNLNLSEQYYRNISHLTTGEYFIFHEKMQEATLLKVDDVRKELKLSDDVEDEDIATKKRLEVPFMACHCKKGCDMAIRNEADFIARKLCNMMGSLLQDPDALDEYMKHGLDDAIYDMVESSDSDHEKRLRRCARFMTERMIRLKRVID